MKTTLLIAAIALSSIAGVASAQSAQQQIRSQLAAQGFKNIEIETRSGKIKVEARRKNTSVELVYDRRSGRLLSMETDREDHKGRRTAGLRNSDDRDRDDRDDRDDDRDDRDDDRDDRDDDRDDRDDDREDDD